MSRRDGKGDVYTMAVDGSDVRRLTRGGASPQDPAWSPDGARIAYATYAADGAANLWIMQRDGSGARQATAFQAGGSQDGLIGRIGWSPSGRQIVFDLFTTTNKKSVIYIIDASGGSPRELAAGFDATWSPDGQRLAYVAPSHEISTMRADGSDARQLTNDGLAHWSLAWSPDGKTIAYVARGVAPPVSLYLLDVATGKSRLFLAEVSTADASLNWSPDGKRLVYALYEQGIWVVSVDKPAAAVQIATEGEMPAWSP